jgi:tetratricopeptide (TPR) repeat protein
MFRLRKWFILFILSAGLIVVSPKIVALYQINAGGDLLVQVFKSDPERASAAGYCSLTPVRQAASRMKLKDAKVVLQQALRADPTSAQAYLLLGRVHCLLGSFQEAESSFSQFNQLRPKNPMGHLELEALYKRCFKSRNQESLGCPDKRDTDLYTRFLYEWKLAGGTGDPFLASANASFSHGDYLAASEDYQNSYAKGGQPSDSELFRWGISSVITTQQVPEPVGLKVLPVHELKGNAISIPGDQFQWMKFTEDIPLNFGDPLSLNPGIVPGEGVVWWEGAVCTEFRLKEEGEYVLGIRAKHLSESGNTRGQIEVRVDESLLGMYDLGADWQDINLVVKMSVNDHVIAIRFLKDVGDVIIDRITISKKSQ